VFTKNKLRRLSNSMMGRETARDLLLPYAEDYLLPAIQVGIDAMTALKPKQRRPLQKRTLANMLNDYVVDDAVSRLHDVKGVDIDTDLGFTTFTINREVVLRIKKINKDGKYSNYPTKQQINLLYQRMLPGIDPMTQVIFGYRLDDLWREIKQVSFVCWNGDRRHWEIPVADDLQSYLPVISMQETSGRRSLVKPKGNKKRSAKGG
jgi:hypothetical protein